LIAIHTTQRRISVRTACGAPMKRLGSLLKNLQTALANDRWQREDNSAVALVLPYQNLLDDPLVQIDTNNYTIGGS